MATSTVHGRGMAGPVSLVGLDRAGSVVALATLEPGAWRRLKGACWILELPTSAGTPEKGSRLNVYLLS